MPEGDTVHLAARRLHEALGGRKLVRSDLRVPRFATVDLSGTVVESVVARGKHLLFRFDNDLTLHTHFDMDGSWHLYRRGSRPRGPDHQVRAILETDDRVAVGFRLATVEVIATRDEEAVVGHLGPDVLGPDWDRDEAIRRMRRDPKRSLAEVIVDQTVIAGPGNVYRSEVCFLAGLHPWTPVGAIEDLGSVVDLVKRAMEANRETGMQVTTGDTRAGRRHWVYGRGGRPCLRCRTPVERAEIMEWGGWRPIFMCPHCQPSPAPDRKPSSARLSERAAG